MPVSNRFTHNKTESHPASCHPTDAGCFCVDYFPQFLSKDGLQA